MQKADDDNDATAFFTEKPPGYTYCSPLQGE